MVRLNSEHILLIGDRDRRMQAAVASAVPSAGVTSVQSVFDGLAELYGGVYSTVLVSVDPLKSRSESAARALREAAGEARLVIFSEPGHEPLSRQLLDHGIDDYVISPTEPGELQQILAAPLRQTIEEPQTAEVAENFACIDILNDLPLTDIILNAMLEHPQNAVINAVSSIAERIAPALTLIFQSPEDPLPTVASDRMLVTHPIRTDDTHATGRLVLEMAHTSDDSNAQHVLARIASLLSKTQQIDDRQGRLQKLAITDELTGVHNSRYFRHFLARMIERAQSRRFPVTLLLLDLDNFKKYNDTYGHGVGDEILKQTASLMKRCTRDHDMIARIGGDEFAVVFWEKEGPRQPFDPNAQPNSRLPATPLIVAERFRKLLKNKDFSEFNVLGPKGKGILTISGGMAVYPYDARNAEDLIEAADKALIFGAKKSGKNSIYLVGAEDNLLQSRDPRDD